MIGSNLEVQKKGKSKRKSSKNSSKKRSNPQREKANNNTNIISIVNKIKDCEESEKIEKNILSKTSVPNRILLPFYICYRYFPKQGLTTGDIADITSELRVSIAVTNVSNVVSQQIKGYLSGDKVKKKGRAVVYKLNRKGITYFESILNDEEKK